MLNLTIAIPTKNEEKNILRCLEGIGKGFAKEIVLLDSNSQDKTVELAEQWGARVIPFSWNGQFPKKRNWFLQNYTPQTEWIFFLDADEVLTPAFKEELSTQLMSKESASFVGFWLVYTRYFLGKQLRGGYALRKLALFRVGAGQYEYIPENEWSKLDMEVHEHPILQGRIGRIASPIEHNDFRGVAHYQQKHIEYAKWEAKRLVHLANKEKLTVFQRMKYRLVQSSLGGIVYFFVSFFLLGGFLDGKTGLYFAIFKMNYFTMIRALLIEEQASSC